MGELLLLLRAHKEAADAHDSDVSVEEEAASDLIREQAIATDQVEESDELEDPVGDRIETKFIGGKDESKLSGIAEVKPDLIGMVGIIVEHTLIIHSEIVVSEAHDFRMAKNNHVDEYGVQIHKHEMDDFGTRQASRRMKDLMGQLK